MHGETVKKNTSFLQIYITTPYLSIFAVKIGQSIKQIAE